MKIIRYRSGNAAEWGILDGDNVVAASGEPFVDLTPTHTVGSVGDVSLLPPVKPSSIVCIGRNYKAHAEEFGNDVPEAPLLFLKPPSSVIGPNAEIAYPAESNRVDPEAELVLVIGRSAFQVPAAEAYSVIGGYTCGSDVTARDIQKSDPGGQWTRGKGFDTFCPIGPWVETDYDPRDVEVSCRVDGEVRQLGRTKNFIFDIPYLIEYITRFTRLEPGDLVMTGTPEGVAPVEPGAKITVAVEGLGELTNTVVRADERSRA
ncbi:fumarylacetoacetate hydrolase family protein [Nocardiopsis oceani]